MDLQRRPWSLVVVSSQYDVFGRPICIRIWIYESRLGSIWRHVTLFITCNLKLGLIEFSFLQVVDEEALISIDTHRYLTVNWEVFVGLFYVIESNNVWFASEASAN